LGLPVCSLLFCSADPSYGQLAIQEVPPLYKTSINLLPQMNETTMPTDVKTLRKALLYCRDMLDIFVYAYPNETQVGTKVKDVWVQIRGDYNDGYTTIGDFQDLAHSGVNYTKKQLEKLRDACLQWKSGFQQNQLKYDYDVYVQKISTSELFYRDPSELSAFYWQYVDVYPEFGLSGVQNIARLENGLLQIADDNYTQLIELGEPWQDDQHQFMHDYRKLIRSITTIYGYFNVFNNVACVTSTMQTFNTMYDDLGNINDEVTAYDYYVQNGQKSKAQKEKEQITQDWNSFVTWLQSSFSQTYQFQCLFSNLIQTES